MSGLVRLCLKDWFHPRPLLRGLRITGSIVGLNISQGCPVWFTVRARGQSLEKAPKVSEEPVSIAYQRVDPITIEHFHREYDAKFTGISVVANVRFGLPPGLI